MELKKAITFHIIPIKWNCELGSGQEMLKQDTIWEEAEMVTENGILYPHIQKFLQSSLKNYIQGEYSLNAYDYRVYSLKNGIDCLNVLLDNSMEVMLNMNGKEECVRFKFMNKINSFFSPKLIVSLFSCTGILILPVIMEGNKMLLEELIEFNYKLHKTDKQMVSFRLGRYSNLLNLISKYESETDCNKKSKLEETVNSAKKSLIAMYDRMGDLVELCDNGNQLDSSLNIDNVIGFMLNGANTTCVRFNKFRTHLFTYLSVSQQSVSDDLFLDFERIVRIQNKKYKVVSDDSSCISKTFENIYIGSSIEGGAIMTIDSKDSSDFIKQFDTASLSHRYMWIYVMLIMQRHILLQIIHSLALMNENDYHSSRIDKSLKQLRKYMECIAKIKVNTYFSSISDYTQHNEFYNFCCNNLGIDKLFGELGQKMNTLNEYLEQLSDIKKENTQEELTIIVAIFTLASASNDSLDLLDKIGFLHLEQNSTYILLVVLVVLFLLLFIIKRYFNLKRK